jgi:hypothetical protein
LYPVFSYIHDLSFKLSTGSSSYCLWLISESRIKESGKIKQDKGIKKIKKQAKNYLKRKEKNTKVQSRTLIRNFPFIFLL